SYIKGFEHEPEKGKRCQLCFELRLKKTAEYAKKHGFQAFATTLTISPHKSAEMINKIGKRYQDQLVKYISSDFKKYKGYELSVALSKQLNLYRQNYCGCVYSKKSSKNQHSISE
ncbi:MAG TPA: epoxyqueuosine reductase QueH, partial [Candidatus Woesearchaeota archaeon]|nr:epoxyqueuosine reductase QueH [Candidatus Woesearchaeota archaeon]